jgi:hypothetical protein
MTRPTRVLLRLRRPAFWVAVVGGVLTAVLGVVTGALIADHRELTQQRATITVQGSQQAALAAQVNALRQQIEAHGLVPVAPIAGFAFTTGKISFWCTPDRPGVTVYTCTQTGAG